MQVKSTIYLKFYASQIMQNAADVSKYPAIQGHELPILTLKFVDSHASHNFSEWLQVRHVISQI